MAAQKQWLREQYDELDKSKTQLGEDKKAFEKVVDEKWVKANPFEGGMDRRVKINVGGQMFEATAKVLCRDRFSVLAACCSADPPVQPDADGSFFFDRDWVTFRHLMTFLRDGSLDNVPDKPEVLHNMYHEAAFFRLGLLCTAITYRLNDHMTARDPRVQRRQRRARGGGTAAPGGSAGPAVAGGAAGLDLGGGGAHTTGPVHFDDLEVPFDRFYANQAEMRRQRMLTARNGRPGVGGAGGMLLGGAGGAGAMGGMGAMGAMGATMPVAGAYGGAGYGVGGGMAAGDMYTRLGGLENTVGGTYMGDRMPMAAGAYHDQTRLMDEDRQRRQYSHAQLRRSMGGY